VDHGYAESPLTITDMISKQAKLFLPTAEIINLKKTVFSNLQKLEDVNKKAKNILEKYKAQLQKR
jgi:hypothetical protein